MNRRKQHLFNQLVVGAGLAVGGAGAQASLGQTVLGAVSVESYFGEPLRASIALAPHLDRALGAGLASHEQFWLRGLDRELLPPGVRVSLDQAAGRLVIESVRPLREPALTLLLRVDTGGQVIYREVHIILSGRPAPAAPRAALERAPVPAAPSRLGSVVEARRRPVPPLPVPVPGPVAGAAAAQSYGPVQPGETLYRIAAGLRPPGTGTGAMAAALFRANPHAFRDGDMNRLLAGAVLAVPAPVVSSPPSGASGMPRPRPEPRSRAAPREAPPEVAVAGGPKGEGAAEHRALRSRVERLSQRIQALKARLQREEGALRSAHGRVDGMLAALGSAAGGAGPGLASGAGGAGSAPVHAAPAPTAGLATVAGPAGAAAPPAAAPASARAATSAAPTTAGPAAPAAAPAGLASAPGGPAHGNLVLEFLAETLGLSATAERSPAAKTSLVGLAVVVALLAAVLIGRRLSRRARRTINDRRSAAREADLRSQMSAKAARAAQPAVAWAQASPGAPSRSDAAEHSQAVGARSEAVRAVFREADVYVAYGRFGDAAALLRRALEDSPSEHELRVKLAEVLFDAGDGAEFLDLAKAVYLRLQETGDEELWGRVAYLGRQKWPDERLYQQRLADPAEANPAEASSLAEDALDELSLRRHQRRAHS